uniref:Uncharacterized protein n=1 Tax=Brassica oleracea var. oleracea TaxID=109376 RepID=A0A0D3BJL2_BRAOL
DYSAPLDLKAGRLEDRVVTSLLRFWEARNVGKLMSVDFMFLNEKCRQHSKIFPGTVLKPRLDLELGEIRFLDAIPIILSLAALTLQIHTWCEAGSSQGLKENPLSQKKYRATTATTFKTIGGNAVPVTGEVTMVYKLSRALLWVQKENMAMVVKHISMSLAIETRENSYGFRRKVDVSRYLRCTMANPVSAIICLRHGYFASLLFKRHWSLTEVEEKCGGNSSATSSTAVGFEEIMLLHSEVYTSEHVNITSQLLYRFEFTSTSLPTHTNKYSAPAARIAARLCADLAKEIFS